MAWCLALRLVCEYRIEMLYGDRESLKEVHVPGKSHKTFIGIVYGSRKRLNKQ